VQEASIWRGVKPPGGLNPPFTEAAMTERMKRCVIVTVRIDPREGDPFRDDEALASIMGRH
jgi:hypothetical protein